MSAYGAIYESWWRARARLVTATKDLMLGDLPASDAARRFAAAALAEVETREARDKELTRLVAREE